LPVGIQSQVPSDGQAGAQMLASTSGGTMADDLDPAISNPPSLAPSGGEADNPKGSGSTGYLNRTSKVFEGNTGKDMFGLVLAVALYWIVGLWAFQTHSEIFRIFTAYGATFVAIFYVVKGGFWRHWAFWIKPKREERAESRRGDLGKSVVQAIIAILAMVSTFALLSAILHPFLDNTTVAHHGNLAWNYTGAYFWNTIDAIPVLQINETIHWVMPPLFNTGLGQGSEILFRLLVIAPGLSVITRYLQY
jgi:hypothetical protein